MKTSTDVWFIAFLMSLGHQIKDYTVVTRGKVQCRFDLSDEEWQKLKLEFNNSDIIKYKGLIEQIKDLAF